MVNVNLLCSLVKSIKVEPDQRESWSPCGETAVSKVSALVSDWGKGLPKQDVTRAAPPRKTTLKGREGRRRERGGTGL